MFLHRVVLLLSLLILSSVLPTRAQTVHVDSLAGLVMLIAVGERTDYGYRVVPDTQPTIGLSWSIRDFGAYKQMSPGDAFGITPFGDSDDFGLLDASVLHIPEKNQVVTVLDNNEHEAGQAVLALWDKEGDTLSLRHVLGETIAVGIGRMGADAYALFPDGSVLLVVRSIGEGIWHNLSFLRITDDGTFTRLLQHAFTMDPDLEGRLVRQAGSPKIPFPTYRGLGYTLSDAFEGTPTVALTALRQAVVPVYGSMEEQSILDEEGVPKIVNLWKLAQQQ